MQMILKKWNKISSMSFMTEKKPIEHRPTTIAFIISPTTFQQHFLTLLKGGGGRGKIAPGFPHMTQSSDIVKMSKKLI